MVNNVGGRASNGAIRGKNSHSTVNDYYNRLQIIAA